MNALPTYDARALSSVMLGVIGDRYLRRMCADYASSLHGHSGIFASLLWPSSVARKLQLLVAALRAIRLQRSRQAATYSSILFRDNSPAWSALALRTLSRDGRSPMLVCEGAR